MKGRKLRRQKNRQAEREDVDVGRGGAVCECRLRSVRLPEHRGPEARQCRAAGLQASLGPSSWREGGGGGRGGHEEQKEGEGGG